MSFFIKTILTACVIAAMLPTVSLSDEAPPTQVRAIEVTLSPIEYADKYTEQYGVDPTVFKKVMFCESQNKPNPPGHNDGGAAYGIFQFHRPTFLYYEKQIGIDLEYTSYKDQIQLAAYMFSIGEQKQWTCLKLVTGK